MKTPLISVVIPVYNAEKYINACISSITSQSYPNWELFLVNDGSTDKSSQICDSFAKLDCRIKVIHQHNMGPGMARNKGIQLATGDYLVFVDSDDSIHQDYFKILSQHEEDVVFIDIQAVDTHGKCVRKEYMSKYASLSKDDILRSQLTGKIDWGGCRKAAKLSIIKENGIQYSAHKVGEEAFFSFLLLYYARTVGFIEKDVYFYTQREDSQSHLFLDDPWGDVALYVKDSIEAMGIYDEYRNTLNAFILTAAAVSVDRIAQNRTIDNHLERIVSRVEQYDKTVDKKGYIDWPHMGFKSRILGYLVQHHKYCFCYLLSKARTCFRRHN